MISWRSGVAIRRDLLFGVKLSKGTVHGCAKKGTLSVPRVSPWEACLHGAMRYSVQLASGRRSRCQMSDAKYQTRDVTRRPMSDASGRRSDIAPTPSPTTAPAPPRRRAAPQLTAAARVENQGGNVPSKEQGAMCQMSDVMCHANHPPAPGTWMNGSHARGASALYLPQLLCLASSCSAVAPLSPRFQASIVCCAYRNASDVGSSGDQQIARSA